MDHMRISGTEPSSVILSQKMKFKKLKSDDRKVPKQAEAKRDGVINPQNYNFSQNEPCLHSGHSITRLPTDLERSVGAATVAQLVWLNQFMGFQPCHYPQKLCN